MRNNLLIALSFAAKVTLSGLAIVSAVVGIAFIFMVLYHNGGFFITLITGVAFTFIALFVVSFVLLIGEK